YGVCLFKTFTGLPCPACGMTHSFVSIGHLRIIEGFYFNIIGPFLYLMLIIGIFLTLTEILMNRLIIEPLFERYKIRILIIVIPLIILSWVINLIRHFGVS
ncbi:MAG: DUF2752 domain-containing protein, partial [Myxococcota bacterium]